MSLTATNAQVYKGTAAVTYGSGSGVSNRELQGTATVTYGGAPTSNTALSLPGTTGSWMNLGSTSPAHFNTGTSNIFAEGWIYLNNTSGAQVVITSSNTATSTGEDWGLYFYLGTPYSFVYTSTSSYTTPSAAVSSGTWNHVAFAFDSTNNKLYTWTNGTPGATVTTAGTPKYFAGNPVHIGAQLTTGVNPLNGYIRDLRVVQGGIVPTTSFTPAGAPFRLNVPSYVTGGSTVLSLAEQYFTPSWVNFPGPTGNYLNMGTNHPGHFDTAANNLFVECWFYSTGPGGGGDGRIQHIAAVSGPTVTTTEVWGLFFFQGNYADFYMYNTTNNAFEARNTTALQYNTWYHLAGSWDSVSKNTRVFVNGVVGATVGTLTGTARAFDSTRALQVGTDFFTGNTAKGYIQDLRVVRGGTVPTTSFTPAAAPFGLASPSYVSGGTTVLSLATQYYQTGINTSSSLVALNSTTVTSLGQDFPGAVGRMVTDYPRIINGLKTFGMTSQGPNNAWSTRDNAPILYTSLSSSIDWVATMDVQVPNIQYNVAGFTAYADTDGSVIPMHACWLYWPDNRVMFEATGYGTTVGTGSGTNSPITLSNSTFGSSWVTVRLVKSGTAYTAYYHEDNTQTFSQMPGTYTWTSQPANIRIGLLLKSGASAVYTSYYRNLSVLYTGTTAPVYAPIGFTSRAILPAVLVNPGTQSFTNGGTVTVAQTALEPANGITWTLAPTGQGVSVASSTDYALTLSTPTAVTQNLFTVSATNKAGLTTVTQFTGATPLFNQLTTTATSSAVGVYSLRSLNSVYSRVVQIRSSGFVYPPIAMTSDNFTATGTYNGITNGVYISSASSAWGGSEFPFSAFDKNFNGTRWTTSSSPYNGTTGSYGGGFSTTISGSAYSGEWLQLKVPSATVITSYTIYTSSVDPQRTPVDFKVAGSNDGTTWTVIDTQTGITSWLSSSTSLTFTVTSSPPAYIYFRLVTNKNGGTGSNGYLSIGEWVINNIPANTDFYADTLGNLTTAAGSGQTLASWLGSATGFVTTWYDQSIAGNHATQTTTGAQPQIQRATKGPGFMLVFNNGQYLIGFTYSVLNNTNYTVCKVDRRTASISSGGNGVDNAVVSCGNTGVTNQTLHLTYRSGTSAYYGQFGNDISATITNFSSAATEPIRYNLNMASSTSGRRLYVYNDPLGPILTNAPSATGLLAAVGGNFYIGYYYNNPTYYTGELYEVLIFKTSLYDIDNTGGQITTIYQNQLSYTGT